MNRDRRDVAVFGLIGAALLGLAIAAAMMGCAARQNVVTMSERAVATGHEVTNKAADAFVAWDQVQHPEMSGATADDGARALEVYEKRATAVRKAIVLAYSSLGAAAAIIPLAAAGKKKPAELLAAVGDALRAAERLRDAVKEIVGP